MKALLRSQEAWDVVEHGYTEHETMQGLMANEVKELKKSRKKDKMVFYIIYQAVDESDFEKMVGAKTSKRSMRDSQNSIQRSSLIEASSSINPWR
jgi:hypothetical protein